MQYMENWKIVVIGITILYMVGKFVYSKLPLIKSFFIKNNNSIEIEDQKAISYLRNRAIQSKDEELINDVKKIAIKFFDIHCEALKK